MKRLAFIAWIVTRLASAGTVNLVQGGGWTQDGITPSGGPLFISFTGEDSDIDGVITVPELSAFTATFLLPGGGDWSWSLPDLGTNGFGFWSSSDYFIKTEAPVFNLYVIGSSSSVPTALVFDATTTFLSGEPLRATPEPGTAAFLGLGLFGGAVILGNRWVSGRAVKPAPAVSYVPAGRRPSAR